MPYLNVVEVETALSVAAGPPNTAFTQLIALPHVTWEARQCHAIKIANGAGAGRPGVVFIGGLHAREWGTSDTLVFFVEQVTQAYASNSGITLGGISFSAAQIQAIVDRLDIFVFPQVNPDGRNFSQTTDVMWRKNRRAAAPNTAACRGVDLNRNYDFLWDFARHFHPTSAVSNSNSPCDYQVYVGPAAASEPETRNVVWLLDNHPNVGFFVDVHTYSELILYPWGDDENQTSHPAMSFQNPAYDGTRGKAGDAYGEYIPASEQNLAVLLGSAIQTAIKAVRGRTYTLQPSFALYPTAGTSTDYTFSRHFSNPNQRWIMPFTIECGSTANPTPFHPPYAETAQIMREVTAGLIQFCIEAATLANVAPAVDLGPNLVANEGEVVTVTALLTDPDAGAVLQLTIDWGDFSPDTVISGVPAGSITVQHVYSDDGAYTVTATVVDAAGASSSQVMTVTVLNVAPTLGAVAVTPAQPWPGQEVVLSVQFSDPGWSDTHTAQVDWGDGAPAGPVDTLTETNTAPLAMGTATARHSYGALGSYTVTVCISDDDGGTSCVSTTVTVDLSPAMPGIVDTNNSLNFLTWTGALPGTMTTAEAQWRNGSGVAATKWIYESNGWLYFFQVTPNDVPGYDRNQPEAMPGNWLAIAVPKASFQRWFWCGIPITTTPGTTTYGCHPQYAPPPDGAGVLHPWVTARIAESRPHIDAVLGQVFA